MWTIVLIAFAGLADAGYLTVTHLLQISPPCSLSGGCDVVTKSSYSEVFGIPVALLGSLYYLTVLLLSILTIDTKHTKWIRLALILTPFGFFASLYFVYLQLFVIDAICQYCMGSAVTSTLLFAFALTKKRLLFDQKTTS